MADAIKVSEKEFARLESMLQMQQEPTENAHDRRIREMMTAARKGSEVKMSREKKSAVEVADDALQFGKTLVVAWIVLGIIGIAILAPWMRNQMQNAQRGHDEIEASIRQSQQQPLLLNADGSFRH